MSERDRRDELAALLVAARPELHRYASRMLGSRFDGEDVVQDVAERALRALGALDAETPLKPWLLRIAHNRIVDVLRARPGAAPMAESELAPETPEEALARTELVGMALATFMKLPASQRSVLILKDVLELTLDEIGEALDLSLAATKAHLHRGRRAIRRASPDETLDVGRPGPAASRYADLFNRRDWRGLTALLADDVRVTQHARASLRGRDEAAATFIWNYAQLYDWRLVPARAEGRDVVAAVDPQTDALLYVTQVAWRGGEIVEIDDYRHVRYVVEGLVVTRI